MVAYINTSLYNFISPFHASDLSHHRSLACIEGQMMNDGPALSLNPQPLIYKMILGIDVFMALTQITIHVNLQERKFKKNVSLCHGCHLLFMNHLSSKRHLCKNTVLWPCTLWIHFNHEILGIDQNRYMYI